MLVILLAFPQSLRAHQRECFRTTLFKRVWSCIPSLPFPLLVSFIGTILLTSSVYTTLKLIKNPDTELSVKNSLTLFNEEHFSQTFLTLLLKRFYLFLWSIPSLLGIYFLFYSSFLAKKFVVLHPEFPNLDLTSIETEGFLITFGLYFLASILLMIVGNSLYIPQYYA